MLKQVGPLPEKFLRCASKFCRPSLKGRVKSSIQLFAEFARQILHELPRHAA